ncbi:MAG: IS21 family transposase [Eubacteriales bacterium]|nr:IS21 family transposase [Eubacteriales bacterium]
MGCDWRTAKKRYELQQKVENGLPLPLKQHSSKLDPYIKIINAKLEIAGITASAIYHFLLDNTDYNGKYGLVKDYVKKHKSSIQKKATIRVPKIPGKLGQVDWKEDLTLISNTGEPITFNIFLYTLPFSAKKYCRLTLDKKQDTVITSLIYAFQNMEGIPNEIWFDNMLTIVDAAKMGKHNRINDKIKQFAKDMAFIPITCRPRRPQTKGSVEALAKLCDRLLAYNHEFETIEDLEEIVNTFNTNINNEISQSHNRVINEVFTYEKEYLLPLPNNKILSSYLSNRQTRKVAKDSMISYQGNKYSVPVKYINLDLNVIKKDNSLYIYDNTNLVRCHQILNNPINYNREDLRDILASDLLKNAKEEKIETFIDDNLSQYENLL